MVSFTLLTGSYTSYISTFLFTANGGTSSLTYTGQSSSPQGSPSWIASSAVNSSVVFSTNEITPGQITSYAVNPSTGLLTVVQQTGSNGGGPAYLLPLSTGKEVVEPNYNTGNIQSHVLAADGASFASAGNLIQLTGSGPVSGRQSSPHPHEVVEYGQELLVPDLGSDKVWRLGRVSGAAVGEWQVNGYIQQPSGSGPRHIATLGNSLYAIHELSNTITQQTIPATPGNDFPSLVANLSILPSSIPAGSSYGAGELILSPNIPFYTQRYLYASNRNVSPSSSQYDPLGDTIAIFATSPSLQLVAQVHTGLDQIRGMALGGDGNNEFIAAAGLAGGGIAVLQITNGGAGLELVATNNGQGTSQVSSFVWLENPLGGSPSPISSSSTTPSKPSSTSTPAKPSSTTSTTTPVSQPTQPTQPAQPVWGQCGGIGYTGSTVCSAGSTCTVSNPYYSQCLPS